LLTKPLLVKGGEIREDSCTTLSSGFKFIEKGFINIMGGEEHGI
jgi:hypothetical protein